ncbi:MAG: hypothetical protein Q9159_002287 [Coniocarpon cinnabarinum]
MLPSILLTFPSHFLLFIAQAVTAQEWPYNLPPHQKYWPEHEHLVKRHAEVGAQMALQKPVAVKKMSDDPSEMFFLDYWQFEPSVLESTSQSQEPEAHLRRRGNRDTSLDPLDRRRLSLLSSPPPASDDNLELTNATLLTPPLPPLRPHTSPEHPLLRRTLPQLFKRAFSCPTNTSPCASINRPDSCCGASETCTLIDDTGIGDVGCCPAGQQCSGFISNCQTSEGYTSCPGSPNGGCCIPGFTCDGVGCVSGGGSSTTTQLNVVTVTGTVQPGQSSSAPPPPPPPPVPPVGAGTVTTTSTIVTNPPAPSTVTTYTTLTSSTPTTDTDTDTDTDVPVIANTIPASTPTQGVLTCSTGFNSCPASLGGGCCPTNRACGSGGVCPPLSTDSSASTSTSAAAAPPVRPTGESVSSDTVTSAAATTSSMGFCPTGFYMCSAYYISGCCQIGRNCDTTSCPPSTTATVVNSGATILVPGAGSPTTLNEPNPSMSNPPNSEDTDTSSLRSASVTSISTTANEGRCAQGFSTCPPSAGGGCCPSGYGCGDLCTATGGSGPGTVGKAQPAAGVAAGRHVDFVGWTVLLCGIAAGGLAFGL